MRDITLDSITPAVIAALSGQIPGRNREILSSLVTHLHDFCREVRLTHEEWLGACELLRRAGEISSDARNEFILISDILGVEVLCDMISHEVTDGESESTVLGPFHRENAPVLPNGASIIQKPFEGQETVLVRGQVRDTDGQALTGVTVDVWEDAPNGLYEQQDPDQPDYNLRGRFQSDARGRYAFVAVRPMPYPIPYDGRQGKCSSTWATTRGGRGTSTS